MADEQNTPKVPEMVATVARAIAQADIPTIKLSPGAFFAEVYKDMAIAAIKAMREPTAAMIQMGQEEICCDCHDGTSESPIKDGDGSVEGGWRAMIAAALGEHQ